MIPPGLKAFEEDSRRQALVTTPAAFFSTGAGFQGAQIVAFGNRCDSGLSLSFPRERPPGTRLGLAILGQRLAVAAIIVGQAMVAEGVNFKSWLTSITLPGQRLESTTPS